jgi:hypothetical protein
MPGDGVGELVRVAGVIREANHFVALVVMSKHHEAVAKRRLRGLDAHGHVVVGQTEIRLGQRLPLAD